jgi:hypothetical protein
LAAPAYFIADPINAANETPCNTSLLTGIGAGAFTLETTTGVVTYYIVHSGLGSPENNAHIHGPAAVCVPAGVAVPLPLGTPKFGTYALLPVQQGHMTSSLHYVNIHTVQAGAGQIRGQVVPAGGPIEACCLQGGTICMNTTPANCLNLGGTPVPGVQCQGDGNGNMIDDACEYKNWVLADDFRIDGCTQCRCDVNADGLCDVNDRNCVLSCMIGPPICDCSRADVNCDGVVDNADLLIVDCFVLGGVNCCNAVGPVPPPPPIDRVRWYGSYLDPAFDPAITPVPRPIDGWLVGFHSDIPAAPCPPNATFDACGIIGGTAACPTFLPDGGGATFSLMPNGPCCPNIVPPTPPIGSHVRVCGEFSPCAPCNTASIGAICVLQYSPCDTMVSRPNNLMAQWAFADFQVSVIQTGKLGCDGHQIYCYEALLPAGCLQHNFTGPAGEVVGSPLTCWRFKPQPGRTYWLSVQAEVGHQLTIAPPCTCFEQISPGPPITNDFWGWHTTPPGYHNIDDAFMGMLGMSCYNQWLYGWMGHMHWSYPLWQPCADDPTKSMDMAFYLFGTNPGGFDQVLWCQPINPGPPPVTPPHPPTRQFPPPGVDTLKNTVADVVVQMFNLPGPVQLNGLTGPTVVARKPKILIPLPPPPATELVPIEILSLSLTGIAPPPLPPGPVIFSLQLPPAPASQGQVVGPYGDPFPAESFFDVMFTIEVQPNPFIPTKMFNQSAARLNALIHEVPPNNVTYQGPNPILPPVLLFDANNPLGPPVGQLVFVRHTVPYRGGLDIHSDIDWRFAPMICTCPGDMNGDNRINGDDLQDFVDCLLAALPPPVPCPCLCADLTGEGAVTVADIGPFVSLLVTTNKPVCP